jgi:hypothetical protein
LRPLIWSEKNDGFIAGELMLDAWLPELPLLSVVVLILFELD